MARVTLFTSSRDKPQSIPPSSSSASLSASAVAKPSSSRDDLDSDDESSDATEEVDELDSNDEAQPLPPAKPSKPQASPTKPSSVSTAGAPAGGAAAARGSQASEPSPKAKKQKQKRGKPITTRQPGTTLVPVNKVESIVASDPQNGIVSKEAIYIIALATEEFIRHITRVSHSRSTYDKRFLTTLNDFADTAFYFEEYKFLQDMIPRPVPLSHAIEERKKIVAKREALLAGADAPPPPPTFPSARASAAGFRKKSKGKASASANGRSASAASKRSVSGASDSSNLRIRSERVRRRSMLGQSQDIDMDVEAKQDSSSAAAPDEEPHSRAADKEPPATDTTGLMKIKIKARSSATPGASTPTSTRGEAAGDVLALDTVARTASTKPTGPVLELGPRLDAEIFIHEYADVLKSNAPSEISKSEVGSLERKLEDARIDSERSGSEKPELESRNSRKRPPSTSLSEPSSAGVINASRAINGGMAPPPAPKEAEHLSKKRKKAVDVEAIPKTIWVDTNMLTAPKEKTKANGHSVTTQRARVGSTGAAGSANGTQRQPHEDFRGGGGRTIYSARKPV